MWEKVDKKPNKTVPIKKPPERTASGQIICPDCGRLFSSRSGYLRHSQHHSGNYKYTCDLCNIGFTETKTYRKHLINFHGASKISCRFCGKDFESNLQLRLHTESRTGFQFNCELCDYGCHDRVELEQHVGIQHNGKGFLCLKCEMVFSTEQELLNHSQNCTPV